MCTRSEFVRQPLTWEDLIAGEPGLADLYREAQDLKPEPSGFFCRDWHYSTGDPAKPGFKRRLQALVGWKSPHRGTPLGTSEAYELALHTVMGAMLPCHNCGCCDLTGNFV